MPQRTVSIDVDFDVKRLVASGSSDFDPSSY